MSISIKASKTNNETVTLLCDACRTTSVHLVVAAIDYIATLPDDGFKHWGTAQITKCQGCEEIAFRQVCYSEEHPDEADELLFPPRCRNRIAERLYLGNDIFGLPGVVLKIYTETLSALQHNMPTLAGIGVRAIIEAICKHQRINGRDLFKKIDGLCNKGLLTASGAKILHSIRLLGNDAAHDIKPPTEKQIVAAMKVIDHLLLGVYVLPGEAKVLPRYRAIPATSPATASPLAQVKRLNQPPSRQLPSSKPTKPHGRKREGAGNGK